MNSISNTVAGSLSQPTRMYWLDWMKTLAMFFIILGHFTPTGSECIYIFSVQCFFIISGFLDKKEVSYSIFWSKVWRRLYLPAIIICIINYLTFSLPLSLLHGMPYSVNDSLAFLLGLVMGYHPSLGGMWFVMVLILLKIIHQYLPSSDISQKYKYLHVFLFLLFPFLSFLINNYLLDYKLYGIDVFKTKNIVLELLLAYPFFFIGVYLQKYKARINGISSRKICVGGGIISMILTVVLGLYNGIVYMYANQYGNNIFLFFIGSLMGTICLFFISKLLQNFKLKSIEIISNGCIIILAFHWNVELFFKNLLPNDTLYKWCYSLIILIAFIPIIKIVNKYFPILTGGRKV